MPYLHGPASAIPCALRLRPRQAVVASETSSIARSSPAWSPYPHSSRTREQTTCTLPLPYWVRPRAPADLFATSRRPPRGSIGRSESSHPDIDRSTDSEADNGHSVRSLRQTSEYAPQRLTPWHPRCRNRIPRMGRFRRRSGPEMTGRGCGSGIIGPSTPDLSDAAYGSFRRPSDEAGVSGRSACRRIFTRRRRANQPRLPRRAIAKVARPRLFHAPSAAWASVAATRPIHRPGRWHRQGEPPGLPIAPLGTSLIWSTA